MFRVEDRVGRKMDRAESTPKDTEIVPWLRGQLSKRRDVFRQRVLEKLGEKIQEELRKLEEGVRQAQQRGALSEDTGEDVVVRLSEAAGARDFDLRSVGRVSSSFPGRDSITHLEFGAFDCSIVGEERNHRAALQFSVIANDFQSGDDDDASDEDEDASSCEHLVCCGPDKLCCYLQCGNGCSL